jgi:signal transduction histidine kinase
MHIAAARNRHYVLSRQLRCRSAILQAVSEAVSQLLDLGLRGAGAAADRAVTAGLEDARRELDGAQAELRELAAGIHPALLTERGFGAALSCLAERAPVPVRLAVPAQRLPAVIETAVYFICSEALANVGKYAHASRVDVVVRAEGDLVTVLIADDGVGGADPSAGSGLKGVADRIEALGGRFLVGRLRGRTRVGRRSVRAGRARCSFAAARQAGASRSRRGAYPAKACAYLVITRDLVITGNPSRVSHRRKS